LKHNIETIWQNSSILISAYSIETEEKSVAHCKILTFIEGFAHSLI